MRIEADLLGTREIPAEALWGIHTLRSVENFPLSDRRMQPGLIHAMAQVKLACARVNGRLGYLKEPVLSALEAACSEMALGKLDSHILVDPLQGGAGTSFNMNVNEVLANRALQRLGLPPGRTDVVSPLDHVNLHQSTNDTFPTAVRVAALFLNRQLEHSLVALQEAFQTAEKKFAGVVKVGRTQYQDAALTTLGREMGAYADAISRDRWRVSKCEERLRSVNLGGTAIGTGVGAPRDYIFRVVDELRGLTGMGLARAENLVDATQNQDLLVEVSGILKAHATTLMKVTSDLRLLSSGPDAGLGEIVLPAMQEGSSLMPGKVNPVIPEAVAQAALRAFHNDALIAHAVSLGSLELIPFLPLVADALLESYLLLARASTLLASRCVVGITASEATCRRHVEGTVASLTALTGRLSHDQLTQVACEVRDSGASVVEVLKNRGWMTPEEFEALTAPEAVTRLGFVHSREGEDSL